MKLKFHGEIPTIGGSYSGYHGRTPAKNGTDMAFVFENPPQRRTIFGSYGATTLWLPYIEFVIRYKKQSNGSFWYGGVYYSGLCVTLRTAPLESIDDQLLISPTDYGGYVCTDHAFDNMVCGTAEEVAGTVLDIWWNSTHYTGHQSYPNQPYIPPGMVWEKMTEESILQQKWTPSGYTIRTLLGIRDEDIRLLNEEVGELPSRFFKVKR